MIFPRDLQAISCRRRLPTCRKNSLRTLYTSTEHGSHFRTEKGSPRTGKVHSALVSSAEQESHFHAGKGSPAPGKCSLRAGDAPRTPQALPVSEIFPAASGRIRHVGKEFVPDKSHAPQKARFTLSVTRRGASPAIPVKSYFRWTKLFSFRKKPSAPGVPVSQTFPRCLSPRLRPRQHHASAIAGAVRADLRVTIASMKLLPHLTLAVATRAGLRVVSY